jgi:hypothetical protein
MKKSLSVLLVLFLSVSSLLSVSINTAATSIKTIRDVVLIIDVSGSMTGNPLEETKKAANKFCDKVFADAKSDTKVSVISYSSNIYTNEFSNNKTDIENFINSLSSYASTNLEGALAKAGEIIASSGRLNSIKSIVIMTDGQPNEGNFDSNTTRKYPADGYFSAVYNTATTTLKDYDRYTLGFFHSLSDSEKILPVQLLKDIQNKGYYDVVKADDLDFTFGEIAQEILDDNSCPIIIVPGIMGSNLYNKDGKKVWSPTLPIWSGSDVSFSNTLHTKNNEHDLSKVTSGKLEYGAEDEYKTLVDRLFNEFKDKRPIYFFSYDFRQSNISSAYDLNEMINLALSTSGARKVDIVCHSLGGIVASTYVKNHGENSIRKIITLGTPYEGSPIIIKCVLGDLLDSKAKSVLMDMYGLKRIVKAGFPSAAELVPTKEFFDKNIFYRYSNSSYSGFLNLIEKRNYDEINYNQFGNIMSKIFGTNYSNVNVYQNRVKVSGINLLASLKNSYFAVGISQKTISAIKFNKGDTLSNIACDDLLYETRGDGTVPYISATMMDKLKNIENSDSRYLEVDTDHGGLDKDTKVLDWVCDTLNQGQSGIKSDKAVDKKYTVIRIACPVDVEIKAGTQVLSSKAKEVSTLSSFGRLDFLGVNNEIKMLCIDSVDEYKIALNGTAAGKMDYTIRWFDKSNTLLDERIFDDVPITEKTIISTDSNQNSDTVLNIDSNGDGEIDGVWTAKANSHGANKNSNGNYFTGGGAGGSLFQSSINPFDPTVIIVLVAGTLLIIGLILILIYLAKRKKSVLTADDGRSIYIIGITGMFAGQKFKMNNKITFGRNKEKCNIIFSDDQAGISSIHCSINAKSDEVLLTDLGSSYGTFINNGVKLIPNQPAKLTDGDVFYLSSEECKFEIRFE